MAVAAKVFNGPDQQPSKQLSSQWAKVVDSFYIMAYDLRGEWDSFTGANSPMGGPDVTIPSAVEAWNRAGIAIFIIYYNNNNNNYRNNK